MEIRRPIAFYTISPVPTSPLQPWAVSPLSEIGWSSPVQMGVEMLNRGASHKSRDQNATQGLHNLGHPQSWQKSPTAHSLSSCARILVRDETFRPARMRLARAGWEMSSLCYESALIPSLPMWDQWIPVCVVRRASCVVRDACVRVAGART